MVAIVTLTSLSPSLTHSFSRSHGGWCCCGITHTPCVRAEVQRNAWRAARAARLKATAKSRTSSKGACGMRHAALNTNLSCSNHRKFIRQRTNCQMANWSLSSVLRGCALPPSWPDFFALSIGALSVLPCWWFPTCSQLPPRPQGLLIKRRAKPSVASAPNDFKINPHISILMRVIFLPRLISYETYFVCSAYALAFVFVFAFVLVFAFVVLFLFWAAVAKWFDPWMSWPSSTVSTGAKITERNSLLDCSGKLQLSKGFWRANSLTRRDLFLFVK